MDIKWDKKQFKAIANEFVREYQQQLSNFDANATGALSRTAKADVAINGPMITVYAELEPEWKWVENGRKPGGKFPPKQAILNWMKVRNILPRGPKPISVDSLAFLIQRKIAVKGIEPRPALRNAAEEIVDEFVNEVYRQFDKLLQESIEDTTEN